MAKKGIPQGHCVSPLKEVFRIPFFTRVQPANFQNVIYIKNAEEDKTLGNWIRSPGWAVSRRTNNANMKDGHY